MIASEYLPCKSKNFMDSCKPLVIIKIPRAIHIAKATYTNTIAFFEAVMRNNGDQIRIVESVKNSKLVTFVLLVEPKFSTK